MSKKIPFAYPKYFDQNDPMFTDAHIDWANRVGEFAEQKLARNVDEYTKNGIDRQVYREAGKMGILASVVNWPEGHLQGVDVPKGKDGLFNYLTVDNLCRCGSGGLVWGLIGGLGIGLGPVIHEASEEVKEMVVNPCILGEKFISLAVSEAQAGSDIAGLTTTAESCVVDGVECYKINGMKKWITGGHMADFFTVAARVDGQEGMFGINLILVERSRKGVSTREMDCMGAKGSATAYVEFDDVIVPKSHYCGTAMSLMGNFSGERLGIAIQAVALSRCLLRETIEWVRRRKAYGKTLDAQPVVRHRLGHMIMEIEASQAYIETIVSRLVKLESQEDVDMFEVLLKTGAEASMAKVRATETFEHVARDAALLYGGQSYVRGNTIERLYRDVISLKIPGGTPDALLDQAVRLALKGKL